MGLRLHRTAVRSSQPRREWSLDHMCANLLLGKHGLDMRPKRHGLPAVLPVTGAGLPPVGDRANGTIGAMSGMGLPPFIVEVEFR